jgi:hypothetical protein
MTLLDCCTVEHCKSQYCLMQRFTARFIHGTAGPIGTGLQRGFDGVALGIGGLVADASAKLDFNSRLEWPKP